GARVMNPTIGDAIRTGQRGIRALEPAIIEALLTKYERAWWHVERVIRQYEADIAAAIARGDAISEAWTYRQHWYQTLQRTIDAEFARFGHDGLRVLAQGQSEAVGIASGAAGVYRQAVISSAFPGRVNAPAFERWVSAMQPGSPLAGVLDRYGARAEAAIR